MAALVVTDKPAFADEVAYWAGQKLAQLADDPTPAYNLVGTLYYAPSGWIFLSVPAALIRGVFQAMREPGIELPTGGKGSFLVPHISVMRPEEVQKIGGPDKVTERGKQFHYSLGRLFSVEPDGWPAMERIWAIKVHSFELQNFRRAYGLSSLPDNGTKPFHITIAQRRRGILGRNEKSKGGP